MNLSKTPRRTRAYFIGAPFYVSAAHASVRSRFEATGWNTGNLLIGDALARLLNVDIVEARSVSDFSEIDNRADIIIIPAANFLAPQVDLSWLAASLEASSLPVMMLGVGAQFPIGNIRDVTLPDITLRVMRIISERSVRIGVRGEFTAEVLNHFGIKNVEITGCASILRSGAREIKIKPIPTKLGAGVVFNGSANVTEHSESPILACSVERKLISEAVFYNSFYVLQNELPEMLILDGKSNEASNNEAIVIIKGIGLDWTSDRYFDFVRKHGKVFYDVSEWSNFISNNELSVGTRFHGNIMALSQGVPSVFIVHYSRTKELCNALKIPYVTLKQYAELGLENCLSLIDYSDFEKNFPLHRERIAKFFDDNGVPHRLNEEDFSPNPGLIDSVLQDACDVGVIQVEVPSITSSPDYSIEKIKRLLSAREYVEAIRELSFLNNLHPRFNGISQYLSEVIIPVFPADAVDVCIRALDAVPGNPKTLWLLAKAYIAFGDADRALEAAKRGLENVQAGDDSIRAQLMALIELD